MLTKSKHQKDLTVFLQFRGNVDFHSVVKCYGMFILADPKGLVTLKMEKTKISREIKDYHNKSPQS